MANMTDKQKKFIEDICEVLEIDFDDCRNFTKSEASEFISDNIAEYNSAFEEMRVVYDSWALEHGYF